MNEEKSELLSLKLRTFIAEFRAESAALWFLCFYIVIEYIRPHNMYPVLDFLPWGQISLILCVISVFATRSKAKGFGTLDFMFIIFSILVILSAIFAWNTAVSFRYWSTFTSWILMYFCVLSILNTPNRILLFAIFFLIINFKLSEHGARNFAMRGFSFAHWGLSGPPGWFRNSGELAMQMTVVLTMSLSILMAARKYIENPKRWWVLLILFPGTALMTIIGSSSRGGQIALAVIALILILRGKHFFRKAIVLSLAIALVLHFLPEEQKTRFSTMGDDPTSQMRLEHWESAQEVIKDNPLGIGYFNWSSYYASHFDVIKLEEIHNTILQAFAEIGYPGGILFLLMVLTALFMNTRTRKEMDQIDDAEADAIGALARGINLGLIGTFVAAQFMSVLYYPSFWLAFALSSALRHISVRKLSEYRSSPDTAGIRRYKGNSKIANQQKELDQMQQGYIKRGY